MTVFCNGIETSLRPQYLAERAQGSAAQPTLKYQMVDYQYYGHDITELPCVLIQEVHRLIRGRIDANIQCIKAGIQSKHIRTSDTCLVASWPITFLTTAINIRTS